LRGFATQVLRHRGRSLDRQGPAFRRRQDVGRAIHPSYVDGQIQGGVTQGIGWALNEEYVYDSQGRMQNPGESGEKTTW